MRLGAVAILSNYGNRNLGDEATLAALLQAIRDRREGARLFAISFDPEDTEARHGVVALPAQRQIRRRTPETSGRDWSAPKVSAAPAGFEAFTARLRRVPGLARLARAARRLATAPGEALAEARFVARSIGALRRVDCLLVGGGGQLSDDFGGAWAFPYLVLKWTVMARLAGRPVLFVSVGAGPLDAPLARRFVRIALRLGAYRSFRDEGSRDLIDTLGVSGLVNADPAWALRVDKARDVPRLPVGGLVVGLNPFPYQDARYWPGGDRARYEVYLDALATLAEAVLARGHSIVLFPTQLRSDPRVIADLKVRLADRASAGPGRLLERTVETVDDLVATLAGLDLVVSGRFHGILLAFLLGKPVLGLSYQSKIDELMRSAGQEAYLLSTGGLEADVLIARVAALEAGRAEISVRLAREATCRRLELEQQFDALFN
jgi:polysaccharide pyruvyl transferase WcaK-like protein